MAMLRRIAESLDKRLQARFVSVRHGVQPA
jgi:hypothetical protein